MITALVSHPCTIRHEISPGHPECPERIGAITDELMKRELFDLLIHREAPRATREQLLTAHTEPYVDLVHAKSPANGSVQLDPDTAMNAHSLEAALHAAGAGTLATDLVVEGAVRNAFCLTRPPGHHAERYRAMGFCFFGNVAIAARHAVRHHGMSRVAVVDFDVHHGNGTEDILDGDASVLFCSSFQHPFYPGDYRPDVVDQRVNVPLPAGHERAGVPRGDRGGLAAGARALRPGDDLRERGLRRPRRGSARELQALGRRLRVDHRACCSTSPSATRRGGSCRCSRAATRCRRSGARRRCTCAG